MFPEFMSCTKETEHVIATCTSKQLYWLSWDTVTFPPAVGQSKLTLFHVYFQKNVDILHEDLAQ